MSKNVYLNFALAAYMSLVSATLLAEVSTAPEYPASLTVASKTNASQTETAALHKEQAAYHKAMAEHYKSLIAAEFGKGGQADLKKSHEEMAAHHEALLKEHQKAAATLGKMTKSSK